MTERDELVERVARAIAATLTAHVHATQPSDVPDTYIDAVWDNYFNSALAAIAECEKGRADLESQCAEDTFHCRLKADLAALEK